MARALTVGAARAAPNVTLLVWGGITLVGSLLLPWYRPDRELFVFQPDGMGIALAPHSLLISAILALATLAGLLGIAPRPNADRGRAAVAVGVAGVTLSIAYLLAGGRPFSGGAIVAILGFLSILGTGLALSGLVKADAFIAACILWVGAFVAVFILFPLWTVLQASVVVRGQFTLNVVRETLASPGFLLVNNPATPRNETAWAVAAGILVAAAVTAAVALRGRRGRSILWGVAAGVMGGFLVALYLGHGALRNSVLLSVVVGVISTALGFVFALLGERSRLRTRRLLGPFSILPIITPPFVLGLAMIYMFGRRGFVTSQLLGLSTSAFFGPLGVAVAQILAYTPIAYLVLQGVVQAMDAAMEEAAETLGASRWHVLRTII